VRAPYLFRSAQAAAVPVVLLPSRPVALRLQAALVAMSAYLAVLGHPVARLRCAAALVLAGQEAACRWLAARCKSVPVTLAVLFR
jgi:hypothetical protein